MATKQFFSARDICRYVLGKIDFSKFPPPLEVHGRNRLETAESAISAVAKVLDEVQAAAEEGLDGSGILEVLNRKVEFQEFNS